MKYRGMPPTTGMTIETESELRQPARIGCECKCRRARAGDAVDASRRVRDDVLSPQDNRVINSWGVLKNSVYR